MSDMKNETTNETVDTTETIDDTKTLDTANEEEETSVDENETLADTVEEDTKNLKAKKKKDKEGPTFAQNVKDSFTNKKFKNGAYSTAISVIVIAIILVVNLFASKLDWKVDLSSENFFTLTDDTKDYVNALTDDITIYYLVQSGNEVTYISNMLDQYDSYSNISVESKDPVLYPKFATEYTDSTVNENSVIVVDNTNGRYKYVDYNDMLETSVDYSSYSSYVSGLDIEGQITSAIQYVTTEDLPVIYTVSGHGETTNGDTLSSLLTKQNIDVQDLQTLSAESIPEDCASLFIYAPQNDYTEEEVQMIEDYLADGGNAIIFVDYTAYDLTNFRSLLNYYGIDLVEGIVVETAMGSYMNQMPTYIIPSYGTSDIVSDLSSSGSSYVVSPYSVGITTLDTKRSTITVDSILTTSDGAFSKTNLESQTTEKEDGDIDGPFDIAVNVSETYNDTTSNLVVFGSAGIVDESIISYSSLANYNLISSAVNAVAAADTESFSIPVRSLDSETITFTSAQSSFYLTFAVVVVPAIFLITGIVMVVRRRRK